MLTFTLTVSGRGSEGGRRPNDTDTATVTVLDEPGVTVSESALTVAEGGSGTYTVKLATAPPVGDTVEVVASVPAGTDITLAGDTLEFTASDWSVVQTVTVSAAEDADAVVDDTVQVSHAVRGYGTVTKADSVRVAITENDTVPGAPTALGAAADGQTAIDLEWRAPADTGTAALTGYRVEVSADGAVWSDLAANTASADTTYKHTGLTAGTTRHYRVSAINAAGTGPASGTASAATETPLPVVTVSAVTSEVTEGTDATFRLARTGATTSALTVTVNVSETGTTINGTAATSVEFAADSAGVTLAVGTTDDALDEANSTVTTVVRAGTGYEVGADSTAAVTVADDDEPGVTVSESALTVAEGGSGTYTVKLATAPPVGDTVEVVASVPAGTDITLAGDTLEFTASDWSVVQTVTVSAAEDADAVVDDTVQVSHAVRGYGAVTKADSVRVAITENDMVPGAPTALGAAADGQTAIDLVWRAPADTGTAALTGYRVEVSADGAVWSDLAANTASADTTYKHAGLTAGTTRHYRVSAINAAGTGPASGTASAATETPLPVVTVSAVTSEVTEGTDATFRLARTGATTSALTVTVNVSETGTTITGTAATSVEFAADSAGVTLAVGTTDDALDEVNSTVTTVVRAGTGYEVGADSTAAVTVADDDEPGVTVSESALTVAEGGSGTYTVKLATALAAGDTVEVVASVPAGTDITLAGDTLEFTASDWSVVQTVTVSAAEDADAVADDTVQVSHAVRGYGTVTKADSVRVAITENDTVPGAPTALGAAADGQTAIDLEWRAPADTGTAALTGYRVEVSADGAVWSDLAANTASADTTYKHTGLTAGTTRHYRVSAINAAGTGPASGTASAATETPLPVVTVSAVTSEVTEGTDATFRLARTGATTSALTVTVNVSETGTTITGTAATSVEFAADSAGVTLAVGTTDDALDEVNSTMTTVVRAGTGYEVGADSTAAVTVADDDESSRPGAPTGLTATAIGDTAIDLSWTAPTDIGNSALTGYRVEISTDGGAYWDPLVGNTNSAATTYEHTGLTAGWTRHYKVRAVNTAGAGLPSNVAQATTGSLPSVRIEADSDSVTEGEVATFTLTRSGATTTALLVIAMAQETGDMIKEAPYRVEFAAGSATATFSVTTEDDEEDEDDSRIKAYLAVKAGYTHAPPYSDTVWVRDNDANETFRVDIDTPMINEEESAKITITAGDGTFSEPKTIALDIGGTATDGRDYTVSTDGGVLSPPYELTLPAGATRVTATVAALTDEEDREPTETVVVTASHQGQTIGETLTIKISACHANVGGAFSWMTVEGKGRVSETQSPFKLRVCFSDPVRGLKIDGDGPTLEILDPEVFTNSEGRVGGTLSNLTEIVGDQIWLVDVTAEATGDLSLHLWNGIERIDGQPHNTYSDQYRLRVTVSDTLPPVLAVADARARLGRDEAAEFVLQLDSASVDRVEVGYATADGTARADEDYLAAAGPVVFEPGETRQTVRIAVLDDGEAAGDETFTLTLSSPTNATLGDAVATGTIGDNDESPLTASFEDMPASHDGETFTFGLTFSEEVGVSSETLRDDAFDVTGGAVHNAARKQQGSNLRWTITVEPDSSVAVQIALPKTTDCNASGAICTSDSRPLSNSLSATVAGPTPTPTVSVSDASATEGDAVAFTVSLSAASGQQVTVQYATSGGTAASGTDFTAASGTLTFVANETSKTVNVATTDDSADEDDETFTLTLSSPTNATLGDATATGTINDDDVSTTPLTASFSNMPASHTGGEFTFGLAFSEEVELSYVTLRDTAFAVTGGEVKNVERQQQGSNQAWNITVGPSGEGAVTITLPETTNCNADGAICTDDGRPLSHSLSATVAGPAATPAVSVSDASATEGDPVEFTVSLSAASSQQVTVDYATSGGTAASGTDFTAASGTLTFVASETSKTVNVATTDDSADEDDETFTLTLSSPTNATLGDATATGTINDDDVSTTPLTASFSNMPASHTGGEFTFGLAFSEEVELSYVTLRDTAFAVTGGEVKKAERQQQGSNQAWNITVDPTSTNDTVTITLPETTNCNADGAICTGDERPLSHSLSATVIDAASATAGDAANGDGDTADDALAVVDGLTPDEATQALFGERKLTDAQLAALDRLGNRNGRYDLGDLLSWIERCHRGEARCGGTSTDSGPASSAALLGVAAAGRRRTSKQPKRGDSGHRGSLPIRGMRRRARKAGSALAMLLAATMAWSCTDGFVGPTAAEQDPGFLTIEWTGPAAARDIGVLLELEGPGIETVRAPGLDLYESSAAGRHQVVVAGSLRAGPLMQFKVPDRGQLTLYRVRVVQVTGEDYALRDPGEYRAVITFN